MTLKVITHQWHGQHNPVAAVHWALLLDQGNDKLGDEHRRKGAVEPGELDEIGNVPAWWCVVGSADLYIDKILKYFDYTSFYQHILELSEILIRMLTTGTSFTLERSIGLRIPKWPLSGRWRPPCPSWSRPSPTRGEMCEVRYVRCLWIRWEMVGPH